MLQMSTENVPFLIDRNIIETSNLEFEMKRCEWLPIQKLSVLLLSYPSYSWTLELKGTILVCKINHSIVEQFKKLQNKCFP